MSGLRAITVFQAPSQTSQFWRADLAVAYAGPDPGANRLVVQKTQAIRVLSQKSQVTEITLDKRDYDFHEPVLFVAAVEAREHRTHEWGRLVIEFEGSGALNEVLKGTGGLVDVVLARRDPNTDWPAMDGEIGVPPFELVAGEIKAWLFLRKDSGDKPDREPWFGFSETAGRKRLFCNGDDKSGIDVFTRSDADGTWLPIVLSSEGIAFYAKVPDPMQAFDGIARTIWAKVRLERNIPFNGFFLRFVGACKEPDMADWSIPEPAADITHAPLLEGRLQELFKSARDSYGIRVDFDQRPVVPPFGWPLERRIGGSRPVFPDVTRDWAIQFDAALFRINVLSSIDGISSTSSIRCDLAMLHVTREGSARQSVFLLESESDKKPTSRLSLTRKTAEASWNAKGDDRTFRASRLAIKDVKARLSSLYSEAGVFDEERDGDVQAFLPVEHGWLQLPLKPTGPKDEIQPLPSSVLIGDASFVIDEGRGFAVEVNEASSCGVKLSIGHTKPITNPQIDLEIFKPSGRLRGLIHVADCSPADGEILPVLKPGGTRDWPVRFGAGSRKDCIAARVVGLSNYAVIVETGPVDRPSQKPLAWLRDGAWISTVNFAQTTTGRLPVAARNLVPRNVDAQCTLEWPPKGALPKLASGVGNDVWEVFEGSPPTTQILPTLPGMERAGLTKGFRYSLRHDLPQLDDLFASTQLDDTPLLLLGEKGVSTRSGRSLATAAAPGRLKDAFDNLRNNARLTETRHRTAFSDAMNGHSVDVGNLTGEFEWRSVDFNFEVDNGQGLPIGSYSLGSNRYAGGEALAGITGALLKLTDGHRTIDISVTGNAVARWQNSTEYMFDVNAIGISAQASLSRRVSLLHQAQNLVLTTLAKPELLEKDVFFWCRDLPLADGVFSAGMGPDGLQSGRDGWAPDAFASSLYEWRVWSTTDDGQYLADVPLSGGFVARPMRLHKVTIRAGKPEHVAFIASVIAPDGLDASGESEAGYSGPASNLVLISYSIASDGHSFVRKVMRIRIRDGEVETAGPGMHALSYAINPVTRISEGDDNPEPHPATLSICLSVDGDITDAEMTITLFGREVVFSGYAKSSHKEGAELSFDLKTSGGTDALNFKRCTLWWPSTERGVVTCAFVAEPYFNIPFDVSDGTSKLRIDLYAGSITWFNTKLAEINASYAPETSEIRIDFAKKQLTDVSPIVGLDFDSTSGMGLFAVAADLGISGMLRLEASKMQTGSAVYCSRLRQSFLSAKERWKSEMALDLEGEGKSAVEWPLDVDTRTAERPDTETTAAFDIEIKAGTTAHHHASCVIENAQLPLNLLSHEGRLVKPFDLMVRVTHRLECEGTPRASWTTLDQATLRDLSFISGIKKETYAFAARYKGTYRGELNDKPPAIVGGGIVERALAAAGFPDKMTLEALQKTSDVTGLVLIGAGTSLIGSKRSSSYLESNSAQESRWPSILLSMPWIIGIGAARLGPLAVLKQSPETGSKQWRTAWFDTFAPSLPPASRTVPLSLAKPQAASILAQLSIDPEDGSPLVSVEQPFFEGPDVPDLSEAPIFLRSLIAVKTLWQSDTFKGDLQTRVVQPLATGNDTHALFSPAVIPVSRLRVSKIRPITIREDGVKFENPVDADLAYGLSSTGAMRVLRDTLQADALLFTLVTYNADEENASFLEWNDMAISGPVIEARGPLTFSGSILRDRQDQLHVAESLGWPEPPYTGEGPSPISMGQNQPFQGPGAAIVGRVASYATDAGADEAGRPWLSHRKPVVFSRAAVAGAAEPTPRQQDVVSRRPRLPALENGPTLVPSRIGVATVGRRPGVVHGDVISLKSPGGNISTVEGAVIGARAAFHPVIAGQDRMPRSTVFPGNIDDLDWRRETYVAPECGRCRIDRVSSVSFRTYDPHLGEMTPAPQSLVTIRLREEYLDLGATTQIDLVVDGFSPAKWTPYHWHEFSIWIGRQSWNLGTLITSADGRSYLPMTTLQAAEVRLAAQLANGDTTIAIRLDLAAGPPSTEGIKSAPCISLNLPFAVVDNRPRLNVPRSTLTFGDPAYDRMLSSLTVSDTVRLGQSLVILAADRESYDRTTPLLIGLAVQKPDGTLEWPSFSFSVSWFRTGSETQTSKSMTSSNILALTLDDITGKLGLPRCEPGDRLAVTADYLEAVSGAKVTLSVQLQVSSEPVVPPSPSVYYLITRHSAGKDAATALSARGPMGTITEYGALKSDLMSGFVRRRALFIWDFTPDSEPQYDRFGFLVKIDRSGAAQLPSVESDFEEAIEAPSLKEHQIKTAWQQ
ncbi:hypothetical protein [Agrobacterium tumefaciens]|uniref:hypothetical protein n=1 Tax=Agrobacterium tumefaciens TaxID=358 RepID=UPI00129A4CB1|nr:hypothetical protein [Agrobacterium tumefaciens]MRH98240.1 hypothetical protein [Agrobacterium tumefaciens]